MSTRMFLIIGAVVALAFGFAFLIAPAVALQLYGVHDTTELLVGYRYFGVALLTIGLVTGAMRSCGDPTILRPVLIALGTGNAVGVLVSAWATVSGALNGLGWLNVLIYAGLTVGAAYRYTAAQAARPYATA